MNDDVFILKGEDEEMYLIDDPAIIEKLDQKIHELTGIAEDKVIQHLLHIVNPGKYKSPCYGK